MLCLPRHLSHMRSVSCVHACTGNITLQRRSQDSSPCSANSLALPPNEKEDGMVYTSLHYLIAYVHTILFNVCARTYAGVCADMWACVHVYAHVYVFGQCIQKLLVIFRCCSSEAIHRVFGIGPFTEPRTCRLSQAGYHSRDLSVSLGLQVFCYGWLFL